MTRVQKFKHAAPPTTQLVEEKSHHFNSQDPQLIRSFWAGKLVQDYHLYYAKDESCDHHDLQHREKLISEALHSLTLSETSLSPRVLTILTGGEDEVLSEEKLLLDDGTLDWSKISKNFDPSLMGSQDLIEGARLCRILADHVHRQIIENSGLATKLEAPSNYTWTAHPEVFSECAGGLGTRVDPKLQVNTSILLCAAGLERALGDVFLSVSESKRCPHLLKDLLSKKELAEFFSPHAMFLLRCLIGPPTGLNLRNILWHGFADCEEIPSQFSSLLLVLVASLGKMLSPPTSPLSAILHRPLVSFPQEAVLNGVFNDLTPALCQKVKSLFSQSYFILPSMLPTWEAALQAFDLENYGVCLCLLLPALEHGLRRVFACVNHCPSRILTAEADTLYTTFDEILNPVLENGERNALIDEIGTSKMEMLLDVLVHTEGLRLRDKISHGEAEFFSLSRTLANHMLSIAVLFCIKYSLVKEFEEDGGLGAAESHYTSLFHPLSLLRRELEELEEEAQQLDAVLIPPQWRDTERKQLQCDFTVRDALRSLICTSCGTSLQPHPPSSSEKRGERVKEVLTCAWARRTLDTLFMPRQKLELVGLMRRTASNTTAALKQVRLTAEIRYPQHAKQELRSRQRANYGVLLSSLPLYQDWAETLILTSALTTARLKSLDQDLGKTIKFHKKVQQFSENFSSLSSPSQNRWEEINTLCNSLATLIQQHATSLATLTQQHATSLAKQSTVTTSQ